MWVLVFIHHDMASTSLLKTRAKWYKLLDQVLVKVLLPCKPQSADSSLSLRQIQDARNHVNQALLLLGSHDESYRFKTGAEVNKVSGSRVVGEEGETSLLHPCASDLVSCVPLPGAAHGCGDAPAHQSEEPPHHAGLHDAARTGHQRADGMWQKAGNTLHTVHTHWPKQSAVGSYEKALGNVKKKKNCDFKLYCCFDVMSKLADFQHFHLKVQCATIHF